MPLNMNAPTYGVPVQQNGYRPPAEKKNKNLKIGIIVGVAAVVVIVAVVLIIVLTSGSGGLKGTYYLNSETSQGSSMSRDDIKSYFGGDITLTINDNNQGTLSYNNAGSIPITFDTGKKTVTSSLGNGIYTVSGNTLTITFTEGQVVDQFIKQ